MISLSQIEQDLVAAMKAKDQVAVDTLRGLKTRIQNEKIAKQKDLTEDDLVALVKNEVKRRKEAASVYTTGNRAELAQKELAEAAVLEKYLPEQMSAEQLSAIVDKTIADMSATAADFGKVMGKLKATVGNQADGAILAKLLKERLK
jgi:uncharacterized protein YqeY